MSTNKPDFYVLVSNGWRDCESVRKVVDGLEGNVIYIKDFDRGLISVVPILVPDAQAIIDYRNRKSGEDLFLD